MVGGGKDREEMREILFRAKAINRDKGYHRSNYKNGDWVYGLITRLYDEKFENLPAEMTDLNGVSGIEIDHNTICQYTGLTDKNGNKIWENDIVDIKHYAENAHEVKWGYGGFYIGINGLLCHYNTVCEVIGNIFDNADLLKGE